MLVRKVERKINEWIKNDKEALLITGARQIGKTYIIRECLKQCNKTFVEFNFVERPELLDIFKNVKDVKDILLRISIATSETLIKNETIIFFDEVQECKEILTQIKFLVDDGTYKFILSGSLLGVELNDLRSVPVGYLKIIDIYPLDFEEFLLALNVKKEIIENLRQCYNKIEKVDNYVHEKIIDIFYLYLIVGGMSNAVTEYIETNNLKRVEEVHQKIIRLYKYDFSKYDKEHKLSLLDIYDSMASELDSKNKRFKIKTINEKDMLMPKKGLCG